MATIPSLSPGKIYAFQVRARTAVGYGPYSGKMYFQTLTGGKCWHLCRDLHVVTFHLSMSLSALAYLLEDCYQTVLLKLHFYL